MKYPPRVSAYLLLVVAVRTALVALIAFMPTNPNGALGSLDYKKEERHALAIKSRETPPKFGTPERQKLIDEIHEYMLSKAPPVPRSSPSQVLEENSPKREDEAQKSSIDDGAAPASESLPTPPAGDGIVEGVQEAPVNPNPGHVSVRAVREVPPTSTSNQLLQTRVQKPADDRLFTWAAVGLTLAILVLLLKKFMKSSGPGAVFMDGS